MARFAYDEEGNLTNQVDMGGNSYGYTYVHKTSADGGTNDLFLASIIKPTGSTTIETEPADGISSGLNFDAYPPKGAPMWANYRITITHPDGTKEEYFYYGGILGGGIQTWHRTPSQMAKAGDPLDLPRTQYYFAPVPGAWDRVGIGETVNADGTGKTYGEFNSNRQPQSSVDEMGRTTYYAFNAQGRVLQITDALGNTTAYGYAANGLDQICKTNALGIREWDRTHDGNRRITSVTDAMGRATHYAYDAFGLLVAITNNIDQVTSYVRDPNHQVAEVKMGTNVMAAYTYDAIGRVHTETDATGVTRTYDYDGLDRVTRIGWADGTCVSNVWGCCKLERQIDRIGRTTEIGYTHDGKVSWVRDPAGRVTQQLYDQDGNRERLVDPSGNVTRWEYDAMGRTTRKIYADNTSLRYAYDAAGNLVNHINARGQSIQLGYDAIDRVIRISGSGLASVTNRYDALGRLTNMVDGIGSTICSYYDDSSPKEVDGPWADDTFHYEYDGLGRQYIRTLSGASITNTYDVLGRKDAQDSPLGHFEFDYLGASEALTGVTRPNGLMTAYEYFPASQDRLLQTIHHTVGANTVSRFDYKYNAAGQITNWVVTQAAAPFPEAMGIGYDPAGQLARASVRKAVDGTPIREYTFAYDPSGNRISEAAAVAGEPANMVSAQYNDLNQVTNRTGGAMMAFRGRVNEPAAVAVAGQTARVRAGGQFDAVIELQQITNDIPVVAVDAQGNTRTNVYRVVSVGSGERSFMYDLDGNMVSGAVAEDGVPVSMTWDPLNQLVSVYRSMGGVAYLTEFGYDSQGRCVRIVEHEDEAVVDDRRFVWDASKIVEERDSANFVRKRFFDGGFEAATGASSTYYYTHDHIDSVREVLDESGSVRTAYKYEPWGASVALLEDVASDKRFTGHLLHSATGVYLAIFRPYSAALGRWLCRDPKMERGGVNLYAYVSNDPVNYIDLLGLQGHSHTAACCPGQTWSGTIKYSGRGSIVQYASGTGKGMLRCNGKPSMTADVETDFDGMGIGWFGTLSGNADLSFSPACYKADLVGLQASVARLDVGIPLINYGHFHFKGVRPYSDGFEPSFAPPTGKSPVNLGGGGLTFTITKVY